MGPVKQEDIVIGILLFLLMCGLIYGAMVRIPEYNRLRAAKEQCILENKGVPDVVAYCDVYVHHQEK